MARKLKTYATSAGFFDLVVAAPSMKAALEAWGSKSNLFHHGFAREVDDPRIVAATMAKPGVVLRRAVGSSGAYSEHAELPRNLPAPAGAVAPKAKKDPPKSKPAKSKPAKSTAADDRKAQRAARAYEKEQKRREDRQRKEEAAREKEHRRRQAAIDAAQAALDDAGRDHDAEVARIDKQRAALETRAEAEESRWRKQKEALETALRKARSVSYLRPV